MQAHNLAEGIHNINCKFEDDDKRCETCIVKCKHCDCFLKFTKFKDDLIE